MVRQCHQFIQEIQTPASSTSHKLKEKEKGSLAIVWIFIHNLKFSSACLEATSCNKFRSFNRTSGKKLFLHMKQWSTNNETWNKLNNLPLYCENLPKFFFIWLHWLDNNNLANSVKDVENNVDKEEKSGTRTTKV